MGGISHILETPLSGDGVPEGILLVRPPCLSAENTYGGVVSRSQSVSSTVNSTS